jgi:hypothetical protein
MVVLLSIPRRVYRLIKPHLFKDANEQGCFLFSDTQINGGVINLNIKRIHLIKNDHWDYQSSFHLELKEKEKVKIMLMARRNNYDLVECHSHCTFGIAQLSSSDKYGLNEFIEYVWWKLPGKIYGALVWTENDVTGQVWLPKKKEPLSISEIRIIN